ncbi:lactadherin-like isoform X2 [Haliotis asinina]|uniref:lactadherin-like isoform X2 n=1 Tax=Haliotis asinina TaxID=109174 RepID=UPI003531D9A9
MKDQVLNMWGLITIVVIFSSQCLAAEKASCDKNPCQNNGVCKVSNNTVVCTCTKGYSGDRCQNADKAACDKNPCTNNGACKVSNNKVVCTCKKGYSGNRCESSAATKMSGHILLFTFAAVIAVMNLN